MSICAAAICAGLGFASAAAAQPETLKEGLFGRPSLDGREFEPPMVARYTSEDGDAFVLDRTQGRPLLKFDDSPEVWVLNPQPAPRGDVIYKDDLGEPVLRATRLGGLTVFTPHRPSGEAVALTGGGSPLRLAVLGPQALAERVVAASSRASHAARRLIPFDVEATPRSSGLIADAALVVSEAVVRISRRADASRMLAKLREVKLVEGRKPTASLSHGALQVTVAPAMGLAGRPSSKRIVMVTLGSR
ncbi:MAG TPA: DUF4908 domain-containing protein [Phenylobacterium sp.]|uniref:DUF4908 domain-containing protein n=1 Tax=Phenylobacterium sp. TaxID=1871053 RepID=UPI002BBF514B|nr:DUF4908 domain-containing protein [Phenylobacterium sp.]HSV04356.1 DUF4908 domain-containing protein [Phenylobacterium sp.]